MNINTTPERPIRQPKCRCGRIGTIGYLRPDRNNRIAYTCEACYGESLLADTIRKLVLAETSERLRTKPTVSSWGFRCVSASPRGLDWLVGKRGMKPTTSRYHSEWNCRLNSTIRGIGYLASTLVPEGDIAVTGDIEVTFKVVVAGHEVSKKYEARLDVSEWQGFIRDSEEAFLATMGLKARACKTTGKTSRKNG